MPGRGMGNCNAGSASTRCCRIPASRRPAARRASYWCRRPIWHNGISMITTGRHEPLQGWWHRADALRRLTLLLWAAALLAVLVRLSLATRYGGVYPIFAGAGRNWLAGAETYLTYGNQDVYRYSPLITALLTPLSLL